ncbi:MAG TPA: hypothetical protein VH352_22550, partial [Pseudonocardiaceae bacterium]|nr:hypothetical protein [Pseudonocardiaceae bacterium]
MTGSHPDRAADAPRVGGLGFLRHLRAEVIVGEAVYLFGERSVTTLSGNDIQALAGLLDGTRDVPALCAALADQLSSAQVTRLVDRLVAARLVGWQTPETEPGTAAYWDAIGTEPPAAATGLALVTVDDVDPSATIAALRATGFQVHETPADRLPGEHGLTVVLCEDYLAPELAVVDATHRLAGLPWLLAKPTGTQAWLG